MMGDELRGEFAPPNEAEDYLLDIRTASEMLCAPIPVSRAGSPGVDSGLHHPKRTESRLVPHSALPDFLLLLLYPSSPEDIRRL